jgi:SAM-dependent methyltransferase
MSRRRRLWGYPRRSRGERAAAALIIPQKRLSKRVAGVLALRRPGSRLRAEALVASGKRQRSDKRAGRSRAGARPGAGRRCLPRRPGAARRRAPPSLSRTTIGHYDRHADDYLRFTLDHDIHENYAAFLSALGAAGGGRVLDLGCGIGRDLRYFRDAGYDAVGLDGSKAMAAAARKLTGCPVWRQDFLDLHLPAATFDGIFANASLFHVPPRRLPAVLAELRQALRPDGVLFASNPCGRDEEGWFGDRYLTLYSQRTWCRLVRQAGFRRIGLFHRPPGQPRRRQTWLATLWRRV